jgi:hypothetical protein
VRNEHVIAIYAVEDEHSPPYLVMEYVAGTSLQERLDRDGPLELREVLRVGLQTAEGLAAAHAQGLVHRDIKPGNILLENGVQRVKITDFGLARAVDDASLSQSGTIAGTPMYMSPEQAQGEALDHRSDLFSLGSVLYALCTGRPPFRASGTMAVLKRVCEEQPRPIREVNPDVPEWLCDVIAKLQAKEAKDRYQSAAAVAELLRQYLAHLQQPSLAPPPRVEGPPAPPTPKRRLTWGRGAVAAAMTFLIFGASAYWGERLAGWISRPRGDGVVQVWWQDQDLAATLEGEGKTLGPVQGRAGVAVGVSPGTYTLKVFRGEKLLHSELLIVGDHEHKDIHLPPFPAEEGGWVQLFNGKDLTGWKMHPHPGAATINEVVPVEKDGKLVAYEGKREDGERVPLWRVEDGVLIGSGQDSHLFSERGDYANFRYRVEAMINDGGNSGQFFRTAFAPGDLFGYEAQINATHHDPIRTGSLYPSLRSRVWSNQEREKMIVREALHKPDEWFTQEVIADGNHIIIKVNGKVTVDFVDEKNTFRRGHFALQVLRATVVKFKKVEVKELPE